MRTHTYLTGALVARTGDEAAGPALLLAGFAVAGSTSEASALLAGTSLSAALGGPLLGALLDGAARPGRLLAGALGLYAGGLALVLGGLGHLPFAVTLATAVLTGLVGPALSGGWSAQLPAVAARDRLSRANALDTLTFGAAALAGPVLAGAATETLGAPTAVVLAAALVAAAAPAAWLLPRRARGAGTSRGILDALAAGARTLLRNRRLARATCTSVVSCVAQGMLTACVPLLGERILGGAGRGAALLSCAAVSALAVNALLARFPPRLSPDALVRAGALVQALAPALALTGEPAVLVAAFLVSGLGEGPQLTALFEVRHREAPEGLRGQVFTTGASLKITGFALGAAAAGPLAAWSLPAALTAATATALLAAVPAEGLTPAAWRSAMQRDGGGE
ncbi:MFS transporter [Streptomyces sp. NPDC059695]|uniref:MFS transporter n=1 Tax=Streptomyces sp. NPDC059695 TaxID=3346910 RepID=UPI0036AC80E2